MARLVLAVLMLAYLAPAATAQEPARLALKERLVGLKVQWDELAQDIAELQKWITTGKPATTPEKVDEFATVLRGQLHHGRRELRQAYARLAMREVRVSDKEIRITGSKAVQARASERPRPNVREWRPRQDLNLRPSD